MAEPEPRESWAEAVGHVLSEHVWYNDGKTADDQRCVCNQWHGSEWAGWRDHFVAVLAVRLQREASRVAELRVALRAVLTDMATFERNRLHDPNGLRSYRDGMRALGYRVSEPVNIGASRAGRSRETEIPGS